MLCSQAWGGFGTVLGRCWSSNGKLKELEPNGAISEKYENADQKCQPSLEVFDKENSEADPVQ